MKKDLSSKKVAVIGSGFSGLATATVLADQGLSVEVFEKNDSTGGRARKFEANGFTFDMGPSWYWMPDVVEKFFNRFDRSTTDYFQSIQLDPGFRVYYGKDDYMDIPAELEGIYALFEQEEKGAADKLKQLLDDSEEKYNVGVNDLVYRPSYSVMEFVSLKLATKMLRLKALKSFEAYTKQFFTSPRLLSLMEFPILFLGGTGKTTPSLYSLMNYACFSLGTWYPQGGFNKIIEGMHELATEKGVSFNLSNPITQVEIKNKRIQSIQGNDRYEVDGVIASADYHHFEQNVLEKRYRTYSEDYWDKRVMSPSSLIFYLGLNQEVPDLTHHSLFFDEDFADHAKQIYDTPSWPDKPLFYICCPSKSDPTVAPKDKENVFILMPMASGIEDTEELREKYFEVILGRIKKIVGVDFKPMITYKKSYCIKDFKEDYNSYKGNAYGLANTLKQTAFLKPSMRNKKVENLFYTGQLTVPGPGVPPSIISGQVAAQELLKYFGHNPFR